MSVSVKRLSQASGQVDNPSADDSGNAARLVRSAILLHTGPEGEPTTFMSGDGEISFDADRIQRICDNMNELYGKMIAEYGGIDKTPEGAYQAMLDQHNDDSNHRILGRLIGPFSVAVRDIPKVGKNCVCLISMTLWLGEDTVQKVKDGRIYHLSVGIDEVSDTLTETSAVITPAATGAMLLKKGKEPVVTKKLSQPKAEKVSGSKLKKGEPSMSTKNLAAQKQASAKRLKALAGIQTTIKNLSTSLVSTSKNVKLVAAQGEVRTRLSGLMRAGKLTPAEAKNIDIKKLAALPKEAREVSLSVLDAMEPKVPAGQRGTSDAIDFSQMGKEMKNKEIKNLKAEIRGDIRKLSGKSLKEESEEEKSYKKEMAADPFEKKEKEHESKKEMSGDDMHKCMSEMKSHLEKGDAKAALACHEKMSKHMSSEEHDEKKMSEGMDGMMAQENPEEQASANSEMQGQIDELNTNMARIAGMVQELMEVEKSEGEAMEKTGEEHQELKHGDSEEEHELEGEEDDEEMAEGEEESEDKKKLAEDKSKADEKEKAKLKKEMKKK